MTGVPGVPGVLGVVGDLVEDVVVRLHQPVEAATDTACTVLRRRGGSAANVADVAARVVGVPTRFLGRVGDDPAGTSLVAQLSASGVDVRVERAGRSGTVVVLVDPTGERTMLSDRGASADLQAVPAGWLEGIAALHVPAYAFGAEPLATAAAGAIARARALGVAVSVDASSVRLIEGIGPDRFRALLEGLAPTVVLANADEAATLDLLGRPLAGVPTTVVKRGPSPTVVVTSAAAPVEVPVPRPPSPIEDTTGAGDAFAAGYLGALLRGASPLEAAAAGNEVAVAVLTSPR